MASWNDPDDILHTLIDLQKDDYGALRDAVLDLVDHEDPDVREEAVRKIYVHWTDVPSRSKAVDALRFDPSPGVRRVAAFGVAATASDTTQGEDTRVLLQTFLNESEEIDVRGAAYEALLLLHKRREFPPVKREIDLDRDVDWNWVSVLRSQAAP